MSISALNKINNHRFNPSFAKKKPKEQQVENKDENPISRGGEAANLAKATFIAGLAFGGRRLWQLVVNGDFEIDRVARTASRLVDRNKPGLSYNKMLWYKFGAFAALIAAGLAGFALLYTAFKTPKISYESKVNAFSKSKEMDVYTKSNEAERELYTQLANKAQNSTSEEKKALKEQYLKLKMAKNRVPDFVKQKKHEKIFDGQF